MHKAYNKLISPLGGGTAFIAKDMFLENNPNGVFEATNLLEHHLPKPPKAKAKYDNFWFRLRNGSAMLGMLSVNTDKDGLDYVWVEIELPRGKEQYKVVLLSTQMFEFLKMYQNAEVSIRFTLQDLVNEAHRIEGNQRASFKQPGSGDNSADAQVS